MYLSLNQSNYHLVRNIVSVWLLLTSFYTTAQAPGEPKHAVMYQQAVNAGDQTSAILAANYIVASDANSSFKDTLALLYYHTKNQKAAYYWAEKILEKNPHNINMLTIKSVTLKKNNQLLPAIEAYERLYRLNPTAVNGYELMNLQYAARRILECASVGQELLFRNKIDANTFINYSSKNNEIKQTPLKAAILNVYGLALLDLKNTDEALKMFDQALVIDKDYFEAEINMNTAKKNMKLKE